MSNFLSAVWLSPGPLDIGADVITLALHVQGQWHCPLAAVMAVLSQAVSYTSENGESGKLRNPVSQIGKARQCLADEACLSGRVDGGHLQQPHRSVAGAACSDSWAAACIGNMHASETCIRNIVRGGGLIST